MTTIRFRKLHPFFVAEVSAIDLRQVHDRETLDALRAGIDEYGVLVFRNQPFENDEQITFAQRFGGALHAKPSLIKRPLGNSAFRDISNLDENGDILKADDRRRMYPLANRLWHTDTSYRNPAGLYSMLSARQIPPVGGDTDYADMRAAHDALDAPTRALLEKLRAFHSLAYSRELLGFEFSQAEKDELKGAVQPLLRTNPHTGRRSLYIASHASHIIDWPVPEGRLLLGDLMAHATQSQFVYRHVWRNGDLVIWDNLATMHRGRPFDDKQYPRELRRVTTLETSPPESATA